MIFRSRSEWFSAVVRFGDDIQAFMDRNTIFATAAVEHGKRNLPLYSRTQKIPLGEACLAPTMEIYTDLAREPLKCTPCRNIIPFLPRNCYNKKRLLYFWCQSL